MCTKKANILNYVHDGYDIGMHVMRVSILYLLTPRNTNNNEVSTELAICDKLSLSASLPHSETCVRKLKGKCTVAKVYCFVERKKNYSDKF